jgi:hypothetical protein
MSEESQDALTNSPVQFYNLTLFITKNIHLLKMNFRPNIDRYNIGLVDLLNF